jgi:hypothetical protein
MAASTFETSSASSWGVSAQPIHEDLSEIIEFGTVTGRKKDASEGRFARPVLPTFDLTNPIRTKIT